MIKQKHQQLYDILSEELRQGVWPCNEKLPNLKELAARYGVSINVASNAVDLLKADGLVKVKVGDGIYSDTAGVKNSIEFKYSGDRLFGKYYSAKRLKILIEDNADWQLIFWNGFFDTIALENPDIELKVNYHAQNKTLEDDFDIILGSKKYISQAGLTPDCLMTSEILQDFYPDLYNDLLLTPEDLAWQDKKYYLPYGFVCNQLLCHQETPEADAGENILDYIERLARISNNPVGYGFNPGRNFLYNCGLLFADSTAGRLVMPDKEKILNVFNRARKLYNAGHLVWMHGVILDQTEIYQLKTSVPFQITDYPFNCSSVKERKQHYDRKLKLIRTPSREYITYTEFAMGINRHNRFPEESLRILVKLLTSQVQERMFHSSVAIPLHNKLLTRTELAYLCHDIPECKKISTATPDLDINDMLSYFVDWEFYYYLIGRRNEEVVDIISRKINHYQREGISKQ